ncbi:Carboxylic acid reductase [Zhongshania aliphaticivorans]|uniref:Carboxylic acid reductase n=1 Tax=Zhongshania aliphaticivorans TaxID=1470434 RepID=A0A5S9N5V9_9GAMM|nr:thioester reductase domain-containing protein [Zhongshania aliphaticivorans]CAA0081762.1 Carboxylic acid reductase [Zhongshania aliphaticivorans]CAA0084672.1 Carboxylic acid reductase [Zhongshania aliphaticivorans]
MAHEFETIKNSIERYEARLRHLLSTDEQLRNIMPLPEVTEAANAEGLTAVERIDEILNGYANREALGMRDYTLVQDVSGRQVKEYLPAFSTITYAEFRDGVKAIANAWRHEPGIVVASDEFVAIIGFTSTDFFMLDLACIYAQAVSVPLQSATSGADLDEIFVNVNPAALAATIDDLVVAAKHAVIHGSIRTLIAFDCDLRADYDKEQMQEANAILEQGGVDTRLITVDELKELGSKYEWEYMPAHADGDDRLSLILHSSGSTGKPKGAMLTDKMQAQHWTPTAQDKTPGVGVTFGPLNHGMGRNYSYTLLRKGGVVYSTLKSDMSTLFDDIRIARPTHLSIFPRVLELVYQYFQNEVTSLKAKGVEQQAAESQVIENMRYTFLGDRLMSSVYGSAPTSPKVVKFMSDCFLTYMVEGYANTETGAGSIAADGYINKDTVLDYKLVDVPELGYYSADKPNPRGELVFKGRWQIKGYYKDSEATAGLLDEDGYIQTGDIVELIGPDRIKIIDRRKDVIKLSQAEYVAVGPLGTVFESGSPVIKQIFIDGSSLRSYLLAVVVPDLENVASALGKNYTEDELRYLIRSEMLRVGEERELKSFEIPRDFIIELNEFSQENGLLSSVRKRLRPALKAKYGKCMEEIYLAHEEQQNQAYESLKDPSSTLSVEEKLLRLAELTLSADPADDLLDKTFSELGGDSLGAVTFSLDIENILGVKLAADSVLSPTGCIRKWAKEIEATLSGVGSLHTHQTSFASVHGEGATEIHGSDLVISKFIDADTLQQVKSVQAVVDDERVVFITGANGFMGRHACLQWMERLAPVGGKVISIVRARSNEEARERVDAGFMGIDAELEKHYQALAAKHLEVLAGDVGEFKLGLSDEDFNRISEEADRVCHIAALVNHRLSYEHLFGPNVAGTAEIVRLAVTSKIKPIDFISSEGTLRLMDLSTGDPESALPLPTVPIDGDVYAQGYAATKWAGEHMLRQVHRDYGVPVNILRGNMMLPHQSYIGQINHTDMFGRLLYSVIATGLAPESFYVKAEDGSKLSAHYDGSPVDIVAASVVANANFNHRDCVAVNMTNYHVDDGCSLDSFVDAIETAGYDISRVADHADWRSRFEEKLNNLTEEQKQRSAKEVMGAYAAPRPTEDLSHAATNYKKIVPTLSTGPELPHLDEKYIHKCLEDLKELGFIDDEGVL